MSLSLVALIVTVGLIIIWLIPVYNKGIALKNYVTEAFSTMDVYMKKRWDLIPNLLETTKGYAEHEKGIFEEVTRLRNQNYTSMSDVEKMEASNQISTMLSRLVAVAENYPVLKADENFRQFSQNLLALEEEIAKSRKYYNGCVREYTNYIEYFPSNIVAAVFHFEKFKLFEIDEAQRENIKVQF